MEEHGFEVNDHNQQRQQEQEESGWTGYFEDFCRQEEEEEDEPEAMSLCSSSMVSDASSLPARNINNNNKNNNHSSIPHHQLVYSNPKKLNFKKTRANDISSHHDDSLEDTASSPVNSPKVMDFKQVGMNSRRTSSNTKGGSSCLEMEEEEMRMDFNSNGDECTELKKKGLCLVPLSMLLQYID